MKKRLKTFSLLLTIIMAAMAPMKFSMASCKSEITKSQIFPGSIIPHPWYNEIAYSTGATGLVGAIIMDGTVLGLGGAFMSSGLTSTGLILHDEHVKKRIKLSASQGYVLDVFNQVSNERPGGELLSFIKLVKKEIGRDKEAILPTDQDITSVLEAGNANLSLCENENLEFFRPNRADLLKAVIENLK